MDAFKIKFITKVEREHPTLGPRLFTEEKWYKNKHSRVDQKLDATPLTAELCQKIVDLYQSENPESVEAHVQPHEHIASELHMVFEAPQPKPEPPAVLDQLESLARHALQQGASRREIWNRIANVVLP